MRFVIIGAGAVGGVVAGFVARAGQPLLVVARGAHGKAIGERGLTVELPNETFVARPPVVDHVSRVDWRGDDVALVCVKTQDVAAAVRELPQVPIACMTNGIEAERIALRHTAEVYGACVYLPATHLEPGIVQAWATPVPGMIDIGRYPHGAEGAAAIVEVLVAAGLASHVRDDIMRDKRGKLLSNLANAIEALSGRAARQSAIAERARAEGVAVFAAAGLDYADDVPQRANVVLQPIRGVARAGGSTWQSLVSKRPLETDYLNGEIVLLGRLHGVPTPINARLQRLTADFAREGRQPGTLPLEALD